jgi:hypothetical protein
MENSLEKEKRRMGHCGRPAFSRIQKENGFLKISIAGDAKLFPVSC